MNEFQKALNVLVELASEYNYLSSTKETEIENAKVALQMIVNKEEPMNPFKIYDDYAYCNFCDSRVFEQTNKYCSNCGQALDWSEEE